jgi:hypothetical protein
MSELDILLILVALLIIASVSVIKIEIKNAKEEVIELVRKLIEEGD